MYRRASKHRETHKEGNARNVLMLGIQTTAVPLVKNHESSGPKLTVARVGAHAMMASKQDDVAIGAVTKFRLSLWHSADVFANDADPTEVMTVFSQFDWKTWEFFLVSCDRETSFLKASHFVFTDRVPLTGGVSKSNMNGFMSHLNIFVFWVKVGWWQNPRSGQQLRQGVGVSPLRSQRAPTQRRRYKGCV